MSVLIGNAPRTRLGTRFQRFSWAWEPLWWFCETRHPDICCSVLFPFSDEGDGMDANDARRLAMRLVNDIKSGAVRDYVFARDAILESIPDLECEACSGTGIRTDEVGDDLGMPTLELRADHAERLGRSHGWCNMCHGEGDISSWEKAHRLSVEDVMEFAKFLHSCGGFSIR